MENKLLVGAALSLMAIAIAAFHLFYSSRKKKNDTVTAAFDDTSEVPQEKYDVFISFRGSDVRQGFLSHLTKQLRQKNIDVYVDERLEKGEEISFALPAAIERSRLALVIFSKDYASSSWCLKELVKIMKREQEKKQIVIPVFYDVDPTHVRYQKGSYADAFAKHKKRFKDDSLQNWRSALEETANLSGYHLSSNFKNEAVLIDEIINDISEKLYDTDPIKPSRPIIGFEDNLASFESLMKVDTQEVGVLGIWGKGGIGKTTLAEAVFDKFCRQFDSSYFVKNVREISKKKKLPSLLEKIVSALLNEEKLTMRERTNIQRRLRRTRVLLVLDDVATPSDLKYFIEENLSLGPGSKVIITSRDRHVLVSGGAHKVHEMKELNMEESRQLFCWHAFKQDHPKQGYEELSMEAIQYAGGLPLALIVLGAYLHSKDTKIWDGALKTFRKYSHIDIRTVLRVSYDDGLDSRQKRVFLDIAFFFKGKGTGDVIRVLDACYDFCVHNGINDLVDKALITVSRDNTVEIHDLLQEMAEDIVREESTDHPGKRSRLKDSEEIEDVLKNNEGTDAIQGIVLDVENDLDLSADTFQKMSNLRFLNIKVRLRETQPGHSKVHTVHLPHGLNSLSNKLRYFCWDWYPLNSLPLGFCPEKLVEIHLDGSKVKKLWDGVQDLKNLKIINLNSCQELEELPDFSRACNLETVDLQYCQNLCSIHPSILCLPKLVSLNLRSCIKLKNLNGKNHSKSLKHLTLTGCIRLKEVLLTSEEMTSLDLVETGIEALKLPIGRFNKLEELYLGQPLRKFQINELSCLTSLKIFSLSDFGEVINKSELVILFDAWRSLEELHLKNCIVSKVPENISAMSLLKVLSLRGCNVQSLPNSIKQLLELKEIDLGDCMGLRSIPELPLSITRFYVDECTSLETIDFKVMRAIYNNNSSEFKVCYPGSTIPEFFKYSETGKSSITIELAPPSSSDHLLGFASCFILHPLDLNYISAKICRRFHFQDEEINYKDEKEFPRIEIFHTYLVFVWYDPMERILKGSQRRRFHEGTTSKFECKFFVGNFFHYPLEEYNELIKGCGIWPVYASELQEETIQQMVLKPEQFIAPVHQSRTWNYIQELASQLRADPTRCDAFLASFGVEGSQNE